ncbi:hypothetical protein J1614_002523 [Plenodomus biglobosus]|nr:hypothetical protein J1614_002523 [Plenodomus biglobosus]
MQATESNGRFITVFENARAPVDGLFADSGEFDGQGSVSVNPTASRLPSMAARSGDDQILLDEGIDGNRKSVKDPPTVQRKRESECKAQRREIEYCSARDLEQPVRLRSR